MMSKELKSMLMCGKDFCLFSFACSKFNDVSPTQIDNNTKSLLPVLSVENMSKISSSQSSY
ncbi:MAG: hypothetical protein M3Y53_06470, partial [Thermoproteota archaeon]|nr:hypothetical protein [Thermoproteota archaeon]